MDYWFSECTLVMADGEVVGDRLLLFCVHGITSYGIGRCSLPARAYNVKE